MKGSLVLLIACHTIGCSSQSAYHADVAGSAGYPHLESCDDQERRTKEHFRRNLDPDCSEENRRRRS